MVEKRKFKRLNLRMNTYIFNGIGKLLAKGRIQNLSEGGLCFIADREFKQGLKVVFEYKLDEYSKSLKIIGRIVWIKKYLNTFLHGAQFEKVGFWTKLKLKRYIKIYLKRLARPTGRKAMDKERFDL